MIKKNETFFRDHKNNKSNQTKYCLNLKIIYNYFKHRSIILIGKLIQISSNLNSKIIKFKFLI